MMKKRILLVLLNCMIVFSTISPTITVLAEESGDALSTRTQEKYGSNTNTSLTTNNGKDIGIDVSQYSGNINWDNAKENGIDFSYIRIGYRNYIDASLVEDTAFDTNFSSAKNVGMQVGVYFNSKAITEDEAITEANYINSLLNGSSLELPIILTREYNGEQDRLENAQLDIDTETSIVNTFVYTCNSNGYKAGVYAGNDYFEDSINASNISSEAILWNADWDNKKVYTISQYAYTSIPSISLGMIGLDVLDIDKIHHFSDPSYEWSEDNTTVVATRTCLDGDDYSQSETTNVTSEVIEEATCVKDGIEKLTAKFVNGEFETQTKEINIDPKGHSLVKKVDKDDEFEYFECEECGKMFLDEDGENEIGNYDDKISLTKQANEEEISLEYQTHVQNEGWLSTVSNGETAGTTGKSLRVEALKVNLTGKDISGSIQYRAHVEDVGWQDWVKDGELAGTTNQSKEIEAVQIKLTGDIADSYDVYYRVHVGNVGWMNWFKDGDVAGTVGMSARVEAIQIKLVKKDGGEAPVSDVKSQDAIITYRTHIQNSGWQPTTFDNYVSGSVGKSLRLEAFRIYVSSNYSGSVEYSAHVANVGWQDWKADSELAGTTNQKRQIESIKIRLTGELSEKYDVYYRVHSKDYGWLGWTKNGEIAGTTGLSLRVEAIQIRLIKKGDPAPGSTASAYKYKPNVVYRAYVQDYGWRGYVQNGRTAGSLGENRRLEAVEIKKDNNTISGSIQYQVQLQDLGWQDWKSDGTMAGTTGQSRRVETIKIRLTGELAIHCDIYYRVYVANLGWLGWAKNGAKSGSQGYNYRIEAIEIILRDKAASAPGSTKNAFMEYYTYTPTYYSQRDSRWAYTVIGQGNMTSTGCVPTAVAMAVDGILHNGVNPVTMGNYLYSTGEFNNRHHGGTSLGIKQGAEHWGLKTVGVKNYEALCSALSKGYIVVYQVGPGYFTIRGYTHAIVMFRNDNGRTHVYDPYNSNNNGWYSISAVFNQTSQSSYDWTGGYIGYGIYK